MDKNGYIETKGHKPFADNLYAESDKVAKEEGKSLFEQFGWKCIDDSERYKKGDLILAKGSKEISIEAEQRIRNWKYGCFRFDTIHYPKRKVKSPVTYFLTFNKNLDHALIVKGEDVRNETDIDIVDTVNTRSKQITRDEGFINVPLKKAWQLRKEDNKWEVTTKPRKGG